MPRAYTEEEVRKAFLEHVWRMIDYWEKVPVDKTPRERIEGLAFSMLVALDGDAAALPGFQVIPSPHPDDQKFHEDEGSDWWPNDCDIAGSLHDEFYKMDWHSNTAPARVRK